MEYSKEFHDIATIIEAEVCNYVQFPHDRNVDTYDLKNRISSVTQINLINDIDSALSSALPKILPRIEGWLQSSRFLSTLSLYSIEFNDKRKNTSPYNICIGGDTGSGRHLNKITMEKEILPSLSEENKNIFSPMLASEFLERYSKNSKTTII